MLDFGTAINIYKQMTIKKRILKVKPETSMLVICMLVTETGIEIESMSQDTNGTKLYFRCTETQWITLGKLLDEIGNEKMQEEVDRISKLFQE
jgi:hypothetical protein